MKVQFSLIARLHNFSMCFHNWKKENVLYCILSFPQNNFFNRLVFFIIKKLFCSSGFHSCCIAVKTEFHLFKKFHWIYKGVDTFSISANFLHIFISACCIWHIVFWFWRLLRKMQYLTKLEIFITKIRFSSCRHHKLSQKAYLQ